MDKVKPDIVRFAETLAAFFRGPEQWPGLAEGQTPEHRELAVECGLLVVQQMTEPCSKIQDDDNPDYCYCRDWGFPRMCYQPAARAEL